MKSFQDYNDACSYAKVNPGLVVVRNQQNWAVGDRRSIYKLKSNRQQRQDKKELSTIRHNYKQALHPVLRKRRC